MYPYQTFPYQQPAFSFPKYDVVKVSGRGGAEAFQMAPNSSVLLLDETAPLVWLATTDGAGYKTLAPYSITPYQPEPEIDTKSLLARIEKLEAAINDKPDYSSIRKQSKSPNGANKTDG